MFGVLLIPCTVVVFRITWLHVQDKVRRTCRGSELNDRHGPDMPGLVIRSENQKSPWPSHKERRIDLAFRQSRESSVKPSYKRVSGPAASLSDGRRRWKHLLKRHGLWSTELCFRSPLPRPSSTSVRVWSARHGRKNEQSPADRLSIISEPKETKDKVSDISGSRCLKKHSHGGVRGQISTQAW